MDLFSERARLSRRRSFITGLDGEVTQNIEYFPSGEVFVEIDGGDSPIPLKTINKERGKIIRTLTIHLISLMVRSRMMRRDTTIMGQGTTILG
ncbi:hypothetical protein [Chryseobacterium rhizosphaerae]|uniref:hypothetical protein n=1 Tax=Chryseobacterium rhizosphaerae TaxID=395937 RepID=UPI00235936B6|nr:hypothetical protein [Chryseobacterium rhizosphaerae]MDC8100607.1 hypothetical protein [Chryseobacterium rhizosphaerae]